MRKLILAVVLATGLFAQDVTKEMEFDSTVLIEDGKRIALNYGEYSPSTGRPATNYVKPHFRSNGSYVDGYYRS